MWKTQSSNRLTGSGGVLVGDAYRDPLSRFAILMDSDRSRSGRLGEAYVVCSKLRDGDLIGATLTSASV